MIKLQAFFRISSRDGRGVPQDLLDKIEGRLSNIRLPRAYMPLGEVERTFDGEGDVCDDGVGVSGLFRSESGAYRYATKNHIALVQCLRDWNDHEEGIISLPDDDEDDDDENEGYGLTGNFAVSSVSIVLTGSQAESCGISDCGGWQTAGDTIVIDINGWAHSEIPVCPNHSQPQMLHGKRLKSIRFV